MAPLSGPSENPAPDAGPTSNAPVKPVLVDPDAWTRRATETAMNRWALRVGHTLASGLVVAIVLVGCVGSTSSSATVVHNVRVGAGPVGLAHLRSRCPAHLPRPHHVDHGDGEEAQGGMVLPHRRRGNRHPDGGRRHRLRRFMGRLFLCARTRNRRPALEVPAERPERHHALPGPTTS